ncbi:MAG: Methyltransferase type 11 [Bacteroidota bacterium]|nr:Methyltransferase type 11 [Bacteroidota bacterium]
MLLGYIPFFIAFKYFGLSLITIIGIAGYAYLLNDWADIKKDAAASKPNAMAALPVSARISLLLIFFVLALLPWFFFPYNFQNICLLGFELLLFLLYAAPPFRLKEMPLAGILTDALYAHALPALLAALTFFEIAEISHNNKIHLMVLLNLPFLVSLTGWQFFLGIRNILLHQLQDIDNDLVSATRTFATRFGKDITRKWLVYFALPAELIFLIAFFVCLSYYSFIFPAAYLLFAFYLFITKGNMALSIRRFCYIFLDDFYMDWFPLAALVALMIVDWRFVFLFLGHVCLFRNILKQHFKKLLIRN